MRQGRIETSNIPGDGFVLALDAYQMLVIRRNIQLAGNFKHRMFLYLSS